MEGLGAKEEVVEQARRAGNMQRVERGRAGNACSMSSRHTDRHLQLVCRDWSQFDVLVPSSVCSLQEMVFVRASGSLRSPFSACAGILFLSLSPKVGAGDGGGVRLFDCSTETAETTVFGSLAIFDHLRSPAL